VFYGLDEPWIVFPLTSSTVARKDPLSDLLGCTNNKNVPNHHVDVPYYMIVNFDFSRNTITSQNRFIRPCDGFIGLQTLTGYIETRFACVLVSHMKNVNFQTNMRHTVLYSVLQYNNINVVALLVERGANMMMIARKRRKIN